MRKRATKVSCDHGEKLGGSRVGCGGAFTVLLEATVRTECRDMLEVLRPCSEAERDAVDAPERMRFAAGSASVAWESLGLVVVGRGPCGEPKRLSRSLWNLRFVVASASGISACELGNVGLVYL